MNALNAFRPATPQFLQSNRRSFRRFPCASKERPSQSVSVLAALRL
jgi:hypothetical protein